MDRKQLYESVTAEVVRQIEAGAGEWRMPWHAIADAGEPVNALTHQPYRGGNHVVLGLTAAARGWSGHWATYKQWQQLGAQVRRGERASHGVKWSPVERIRATGESERRLVPYCFTVFASEQVDGWEAPAPAERDTPGRIGNAERFFAGIGADVRHGGNRAAYVPSADVILLPELAQFDDPARYHSTTAHEHAHWTGHGGRLARDLSGRFGSDAYAAEELIAELSAAFTCAHLGLSAAPRPDHSQYLASWLRVLRADASALFHAAAQAQAATDYLRAVSGDAGVMDTPVELAEVA
ncbi:MAG TPA: zincin-like metallopeptidase domain-containing protein [Acidimicrobiales bacterium]|nr:zincin-like metallopeptidase domain-containing protein [Acidimicrobiales bacterium]